MREYHALSLAGRACGDPREPDGRESGRAGQALRQAVRGGETGAAARVSGQDMN